jgi:hypothetical protein
MVDNEARSCRTHALAPSLFLSAPKFILTWSSQSMLLDVCVQSPSSVFLLVLELVLLTSSVQWQGRKVCK